jgi:hypothetical protein
VRCLEYYKYYKNEAARLMPNPNKTVRVWVPPGSSTWILITGRSVLIPLDGIVEMTEEEETAMVANGGRRMD